jgi:hypothetical protein
MPAVRRLGLVVPALIAASILAPTTAAAAPVSTAPSMAATQATSRLADQPLLTPGFLSGVVVTGGCLPDPNSELKNVSAEQRIPLLWAPLTLSSFEVKGQQALLFPYKINIAGTGPVVEGIKARHLNQQADATRPGPAPRTTVTCTLNGAIKGADGRDSTFVLTIEGAIYGPLGR